MDHDRLRLFLLPALLITAFGILSGIAAYFMADVAMRKEIENSIEWRPTVPPPAAMARQGGIGLYDLARLLLAGGAFGAVEAKAYQAPGAAAGATGAAGADSLAALRASFPQIIAAAFLDASPMVYLRQKDGTITGWPEGSAPAPGWQILSISLDALKVQYEDEQMLTLPLFAFETITPINRSNE
ncbi:MULTISPECIES: hypothetical protein [unclassified Iodidimonas]|jgi:hypothetical protein|uniref:hypothetical protein n=1 Tax=unclassified Iodidimonas TaxID=2626145 RepID=UPI002482BBF7|nr:MULTISPECIES: hypothetical protein [unclassified Iodidimonas]